MRSISDYDHSKVKAGGKIIMYCWKEILEIAFCIQVVDSRILEISIYYEHINVKLKIMLSAMFIHKGKKKEARKFTE